MRGQRALGRQRPAARVLQLPARAAGACLAGMQAGRGQQVREESRHGHVNGQVDLVLPERAHHGDPLAVLLCGGHEALPVFLVRSLALRALAGFGVTVAGAGAAPAGAGAAPLWPVATSAISPLAA